MVNTLAIYLAIIAHAGPEQDVISLNELRRVSGHVPSVACCSQIQLRPGC